LRLRYAFSAFSARPGVLAAIVFAGLSAFAAEAIAAYLLADVNLFATSDDAAPVSVPAIIASLAVTMVVTLPVTFVPFAALFERDSSFVTALVAGWRGFVVNVLPLTLFGMLALVLVTLGIMTAGIGLVAVFPLLSAASYAAWKDVFGVVVPRATGAAVTPSR